MGAARLVLSEAKTLQDAPKVMDIAGAMEVYAKRQKLGQEAINYARAVMCEALRRVGELLKASERNTGTKGQLIGRGVIGGTKKEPPIKPLPTLAELGITKKLSSLAQNLEKLPAEQFGQVVAGTSSVAKALREVAHAQRQSVVLPTKKTYRAMLRTAWVDRGGWGVRGPRARLSKSTFTLPARRLLN